MDYRGPERFVIGAEESYGFLIGDHAETRMPPWHRLLAELPPGQRPRAKRSTKNSTPVPPARLLQRKSIKRANAR